jgi:hypothetical protein
MSLALLSLHKAVGATEGEKYVGTEWTWLTDYIYWASEWSIDAEAGCEVEVGLGMKVGRKTLGGSYKFTQHIGFTTRGFGAIHVRAIAGYAPCLVKLSQGHSDAVPMYGDPSVIKGLIRDGTIVYNEIPKPSR